VVGGYKVRILVRPVMLSTAKIEKVKLGMTKQDLIDLFGQPDDIGYQGNVVVYGARGGSKKSHYEFHFTRNDGTLWLVIKMPEHETILKG
jgi:hypothetical protein